MALVYKDRVSQDCTAPATSSPFDFDVGGSTPTGFQSFATALATNDTCIYSASDSSGNWEVGIGTWSDTTNALTRTTILASSNSGSAETFSGAVTVEISNDARAMNQNVLPIVDETVTTTNVTGVVNTHHVCAIAGLTANRDITIPSGNVGDRIRITVTDGDDAFELIIKGAASQTINGGTAATEWSRLFIAGETVQLVCVAANTWIVEYDGRIPCSCELEAAGEQTLATTSTWEDIDFNTGEDNYDVGGIFDDTINTNRGGFSLRRAGKYLVTMYGDSSVEDQLLFGLSLKKNGTQVGSIRRVNLYASSIASSTIRSGDNQIYDYNAGDTVGLMAVKTWSTGNGDIQCILSIAELL